MLTFSHDDYQIINKKRVFQGYFAVDQLTLKHRLFKGGWSRAFDREIFERGSAAAVLLFDPVRHEAVFLEQFRVGAITSDLNPWMIEIVAGIIDEGQTETEVVIREAKEEAGFDIGELIEIGKFYASPGGSSEKVTLFCSLVDAQNAEGIFGLDDENEDIRIFTMGIKDIEKSLKAGLFENATAIIAVQWLLLNLGSLVNSDKN